MSQKAEFLSDQYVKDFTGWFRQVSEVCSDRLGLGGDDLPDQDYLEMFENGYTPEEAADAIQENLEGDGY